MTECKSCGKTLGVKNASGYCRVHYAMHGRPSDHGEKVRAGIKRRLQEDPIFRAQLVERARTIQKLPQAKAARSAQARKVKLWEIGAAAVTPEDRKKASARSSATKLAWCPAELRDQYRHLIYTKRIKARDAKRMILEQHENELNKFRRSIGALQEPEVVALPRSREVIRKGQASIAEVVDAVSAVFQVPAQELTSDKWSKAIMPARLTAYKLMVELCGMSISAIARRIGKNHTTILYGLERCDALAERDYGLVRKIDAVRFALLSRAAA